MTKEDAIVKAIGRAMRTKKFVYVVFEDGEYDTATDSEMDSYWFMARVILHVTPDGEIYVE